MGRTACQTRCQTPDLGPDLCHTRCQTTAFGRGGCQTRCQTPDSGPDLCHTRCLTLARGHEVAQATDPTRIKHGSWERSGARLPPGGGGRLETACGTLGTVRQRAELWRQRAETARGTAETACGTLCEVRNNAPFGVDTAAHTELNTYHCSSYCSKLQ